MSANDKIDPLIVLDLLEDELEERQTVSDRRRRDSQTSAEILKGKEERRSGIDRRTGKSA